MAIDPSIISQGLRPPAPLDLGDPLTDYAKAVQIKSMLGQQKLQDLQTQQAGQALQDTAAARDALKGSIDPTTGQFDQAGYLRNLAKAGAPTQFLAAQKSFIESQQAQANIAKLQGDAITARIGAYKNLSQTANDPQSYAALMTAQYKDPVIGPMLQSTGPLEAHLAKIPQDPVAFQQFKLQAEAGMAKAAELQQQKAQLATTQRGQDMTFQAALYGHDVQAQQAQIQAQKLDPFNLNGAPPLSPIQRPSAPPLPNGGAMPAPGGLPGYSPAAPTPMPAGAPVAPISGFRGDRNAPELPAMRAAVAAPGGPPPDTSADLLAAQQGLANAKTPAAQRSYQELISYLQTNLGQGGAQGGNGTPMSAAAPMSPLAPGVGGGAGGGSGGLAPIDMSMHGADFLNQIQARNPGLANQIKAVAEGREPFPSTMALRSPAGAQFMQMVTAYDPTFDSVNYQARQQTRKDFTSGKSAQSINALNTVMGHLGELDQAGANLKNSGFPLLTWGANEIGSRLPPQYTNDLKGRLNQFQITKNAVVDELERAYRGSGGSQAGIEGWKTTISNTDSYESLHKAIQQALKLLNSKVEALGETYNQGMGTSKNGIELLSPHAQDTFNRLSGNGPQASNSSGGKIGGVLTKNADGSYNYGR